jgi:hypothetical protein
MKLTIRRMTSLSKRTVVSITFSLLVSLCLLGTLFSNTTLAQPQTNKIAVIFRELHVFESHTAMGCANWNVGAGVYWSEPFSYRSIGQTILDDCVNQDNTYQLSVPTTAIVEEYPSNQWRGLYISATNEVWVGYDYLGESNVLLPPPPSFVEYYTVEAKHFHDTFIGPILVTDYSVNFQLNNCRNPYFADKPWELCNLPPGQYYLFPDQSGWASGYPPDPDLEGGL